METESKREPPAPVTERQRNEYDRFGPWAYPVLKPEEMPPRFDPWYEELKDSTLIVKMPRAVERRNAKPGSDLYERLLAVGGAGIVDLCLSGGAIERRDIAFKDITALRLVQDLLYGQFCVDLADGGDVSMVFNTVSADLIEDLIDTVRAGCAPGADSPSFAPVERGPEPGDENILFQNRLRVLRERHSRLSLLGYQVPFVLEPEKSERGGLWGLVSRLLRRRLDGCLLAATSSELIFLIRGTGSPRLGKSKGYRYETVYLPARAFRSASVEGRVLANGATFHALRLSAAGHDYELLFEKDPSFVLSSLRP
jgi:hypothetical protein